MSQEYSDFPNMFWCDSSGKVYLTTDEIDTADVFHTWLGCRYVKHSGTTVESDINKLNNVRPCKACTGELNKNIIESMNND